MRLLSYLTTFLLAALLTACGGGGGSPGLSSGSGSASAFAVAAPSALTLQVGMSQQYSIRGGVQPYTVFSNNPAVAVGWLVGDDVVSVGTVASGSATVTVMDLKGSKQDLTITSGSTTAFYKTVPDALTVAPNAPVTFQIGGGTPGYTVTSSNNSVVTASVSGNLVTITGLLIGSTTPTITFRDAAGATLTTTVTVATVPLSVSPTNVTAFINDSVFARISGGVPPYRVDTGVTDAISYSLANVNELTIKLLRQMASYEVIILDSAPGTPQTTKISITSDVGTNVFRLSPATLTISEDNTQSIALVIYGASISGTPKVFSSSPLLTAAISGSTVILNRVAYAGGANLNTGGCVAADTDVTITVVDATGAVGTSKVTVKNSKSEPCT